MRRMKYIDFVFGSRQNDSDFATVHTHWWDTYTPDNELHSHYEILLGNSMDIYSI